MCRDKIKLLQQFGLQPWYAANSAGTEAFTGSKLPPGVGDGLPPNALTTLNGSIVSPTNGGVFNLHAIQWSGFENQTGLDGLLLGCDVSYASNITAFNCLKPTQASSDLSTVVQRMTNLGFNAIRIPFAFKTLILPGAPLVTNCSTTTPDELRDSLTSPYYIPSNSTDISQLTNPISSLSSTCNAVINTQSTVLRLLNIVQFLSDNQIYILLQNADRSLPITDSEEWIRQWSYLVSLLQPYSPYLLIEPLTWGALPADNQGLLDWVSGEGRPGLGELYTALMDAVTRVDNSSLFMLPVDQPNDQQVSAFLSMLQSKQYASRIILESNNETYVSGTFPVVSMTNSSTLMSTSQDSAGWVFREWEDLMWSDVQQLEQNLQLSPWYTPRTAHASVPEPAPEVVPAAPTQVAGCQVNIGQQIAMDDGSDVVQVLIMSITNTGTTTVQPPWTLQVTNAQWTSVLQTGGLVNGTLSSGGVLSASATSFYQWLWPSSSNRLSLTVTALGSSSMPSNVTINGYACLMTSQ